MSKEKMFVYGTLLTGFGNWSWALSPQEGVPAEIEGFEIYHLGGFPGIKRNSQKTLVQGEIFEVTPQQLSRIDRLEGYNPNSSRNTFYKRIEVKTTNGEKVWTYLYKGSIKDSIKVESGDWRKFIKERRSK